MSNYIVSARKYRPATFDTVVGQHALTTTLKNAIATGKLAHAYLFCGPRGVGKTTCARIFARTINCLHPKENGEACNECESCRAFNEGRSYNIHELDAASNNSVEDIRSLIEQVAIPPQVGRYKVFIIDEVHMLSQAAFNAFLKTLEEPPAHAIFILATTEKHKILPTILSRCQIYDFNRMEIADIVGHLKHVAEAEGITYEEEALGVIARKADGGMRDAMSIFDQVAGYAEGHITYKKVIEDLGVLDTDYYFRLTDDLLKPDIPAALLLLDDVISHGFEPNHFIAGLASHLRDLLVSRDAQTVKLLEVADVVRQRYVEQAAKCQPRFLYSALKLCNACDVQYRTSSNKRLLVELTLIEIAQLVAPPDDAEACGLCPTIKTLKPIFKAEATPQATVQGATTATPVQSPQSKQSIQSKPSTQSTPSPAPSTADRASIIPQPAAPRPRTPHTLSIRVNPQAGGASLRGGGLQAADEQRVSSGQTTGQTNGQANKQNTGGLESAAPAPFDQQTLTYHWLRYAATLPVEQAAMAGRLQNMEPRLGENFAVSVAVENDLVMKYMEQLRPSLTTYLQQNLHNTALTLSFHLVAPTEQRRVYSRREQYAAMLQKSEALTRLSEKFKLELT